MSKFLVQFQMKGIPPEENPFIQIRYYVAESLEGALVKARLDFPDTRIVRVQLVNNYVFKTVFRG